jgi:hypothetical protein
LGLRLHDVAPIFTQSIALARGQSAALEPSGVEVPRSRATA